MKELENNQRVEAGDCVVVGNGPLLTIDEILSNDGDSKGNRYIEFKSNGQYYYVKQQIDGAVFYRKQ